MTGNRLRWLRELADLTQEELGRSVGLTHQAIGRWERFYDKEIKILPKHWEKMAAALSCPIEEFYPSQYKAEASQGSIIQQDVGRDAHATIGGRHIPPDDAQLIDLILRYWSREKKNKERAKLLKIEKMID